MILYEGLEKALQRKQQTKTGMAKELGISSRTIAKIDKGEKLSQKTLQRIAEYLAWMEFRWMIFWKRFTIFVPLIMSLMWRNRN